MNNILDICINKGKNILESTITSRIDYIQDQILNSIKNKYGREIYIRESGNYNIIHELTDWIRNYDQNDSQGEIDISTGLYVDSRFILNLDVNTFCYIRTGKYCFEVSNSNNHTYKIGGIRIYFFGKYYKKYYDEVSTIICPYTQGTLLQYNVSGSRNNDREGFHSVETQLHNRSLETLFYNKGVKEDICNHIDGFIENKSIYTERDLPYKTGILLYGEPGTGKTSLVTALATKYKRDLIIVDMNSFDTLDISTLTNCINYDTQSKYIVLLEDIDTIYNLNRDDDVIDRSEKKVVNRMLQFLDSNDSPRDVIIIATTNHIDKLDPAILRSGRFDLIKNISNITYNTAVSMCKSFNIKDESIDTILKDHEKFINPASLQNIILDYFKEEKINEQNKNIG